MGFSFLDHLGKLSFCFLVLFLKLAGLGGDVLKELLFDFQLGFSLNSQSLTSFRRFLQFLNFVPLGDELIPQSLNKGKDLFVGNGLISRETRPQLRAYHSDKRGIFLKLGRLAPVKRDK